MIREALTPIAGVALVLAVSLAVLLWRKAARVSELTRRYGGLIDVDAEIKKLRSEIAAERKKADSESRAAREKAESELRSVRIALEEARAEDERRTAQRDALKREIELLDEEANILSFGFYKPRYNFSKAIEYELRLAAVREQQKGMVKGKTAALSTIEWSVNGSKAEGRKQINQTLKLMLRAFNGECDAAIARVRYNNVRVMEARIRKSAEAIIGLAEVQGCKISNDYLALKLEELFLCHEYEEKVQAEKEEQRRIREQMREEELAQRELERARAEAEKEERQYEAALAKARAEAETALGAKQQKLTEKIAELERRLSEAHTNKERAIARAQLTRSGHVYVISNVGSFGEHVYKIGMTRRLDPLDRIRELGDASVPFPFDVHAVLYSEDVPALEAALHRAFDAQRVNLVNERKEFFAVSIDEITRVVRQHHGEVLVTKVAEAEEYRKTIALRSERGEAQAGWGRYDRRMNDRADGASVA